MNTVTRDQIIGEATYILQSVNSPGKSINPTILSDSIGKIVG